MKNASHAAARPARPPVFEGLEDRRLYSITTTTTVVKVPGPTDTVVTAATNPAGNAVPGQSSVITVSNRQAKSL